VQTSTVELPASSPENDGTIEPSTPLNAGGKKVPIVACTKCGCRFHSSADMETHECSSRTSQEDDDEHDEKQVEEPMTADDEPRDIKPS
jgi:hypothetical protein